MDFKVAGTADGITALQMDIKITGVSTDLLRRALARRRTPGCTSSARWPRRSPSRAPSSPSTPRRCSRSRSSPTRSACSSARAARRSAASRRSSRSRSTSRRTASSASTPRTACVAEAARDRIDEMTRPIGVGDVYTRPARRQDRRLRRVRRDPQGHRRPAARLAGRAGPADRLDRAGARPRRPRQRRGHRGRPRARPHRAQAARQARGRRRDHARGDRQRYKEQFPNAGQGGERPSGRGRRRSRRRPGTAAASPAHLTVTTSRTPQRGYMSGG